MLKGIDVSFAQGVIDWNKVKGQIDFAIIRCGYGDNIASQDDSQWKRNADECTRLGIPFGVYIYSYATTVAQARSEAEHVLRCVKGYKLSLPIYLDLEEPGTESGATGRAKIFADIIEKAGYWCGIYANLNWWNNYLGGLGNRYTKWVAQYNSTCDYAGGHDMWQYTSQGTVPGIGSGNVDMNECYRNFPKEITGGKTETVTEPAASNPKKDTKFDVFYRVRTKKHGWLPEVKNLSDCAGFEESEIADIAVGVSGGSVKYRVHIFGGGWLPYVTGYNINDVVNGYAGNGQAIDAIEVYFYTPDGCVAKKAKYRVAPCGGGYYPWQYDNETGDGQDGYAGAFGVKIGKFQLCIE